MNGKPLRHIDLYSNTGRLEALYRELQDPAAVAVVCHPHPLGGGTLHNKVVFRAARGLENANVATLRFNFRGVGTSGGKHDEGEGEIDDVLAAVDWAVRMYPGRNGTQDEHGDVEKLEKLVQQVRNVQSVIITGADHFFTKELDAVEETMRTWAEEILEK